MLEGPVRGLAPIPAKQFSDQAAAAPSRLLAAPRTAEQNLLQPRTLHQDRLLRSTPRKHRQESPGWQHPRKLPPIGTGEGTARGRSFRLPARALRAVPGEYADERDYLPTRPQTGAIDNRQRRGQGPDHREIRAARSRAWRASDDGGA